MIYAPLASPHPSSSSCSPTTSAAAAELYFIPSWLSITAPQVSPLSDKLCPCVLQIGSEAEDREAETEAQ